MKRNKLLVLGLSFVSVLAACGPLTSTESSEPVSESGLSSETVTSLPSETTTSQAPTSATVPLQPSIATTPLPFLLQMPVMGLLFIQDQ